MNWICSQCGEKFSRYRTRCPHEGARVIEDLAGQLIGGRYRIRELIGVGGMDSTVWKAWQTGTERTVAVKVLPVADEASARRFSRGARIAANLNHPNCSVIHDYGKTEDGKLYLVMEFLQGQVLAELLGPSGTTTMPVADAVHIAIQVLQALEHAHAERAVHRDLKPDNLYLTRKNDDPLHVKILDFGIAKYVEEDPTDTSTDSEEKPADGFEDLVTEQRQVCGTPQYMAPEQVVGARVDQRTDLYSLGCVMYRMLTGRLPFDGKTRYDLYQKHLQEPPKPFAEMRPDLAFPERLELIVMKAMMKRPDQRFQNAAEMRKALETVEVHEGAARKNNRPRVALKDTSPQVPGGAPTILPPSYAHVMPGAGPFTLSAPAASPLPPSVILTTEAPSPPPLPVPQPATRPNEGRAARAQAPLGAAMGPPPLPSVTGFDAAPGRGGSTAVLDAPSQPASPPAPPSSIPIPPPPTHSVPRPATDLLNDAVLRHPASRQPSSLGQSSPRTTGNVAPSTVQTGRVSQTFQPASLPVPRSTETQPNKADEARESRRRKVTVALILAGAFGVGVGGVALVMKLTQPPADAREASAGLGPAVVAPTAVGGDRQVPPVDGPREAAQGASGAAHAATKAPTTDPVAPTEAPRAPAPVTAGMTAGEGLAVAPLEPSAIAPEPVEVRVETEPAGATVKEGAAVLGTTPCNLELAPGKHTLTVERPGSKPAALDLDVQSIPGTGAIQKKLVLEPVAGAVAPHAPTPLAPTPGHPPAIPTLGPSGPSRPVVTTPTPPPSKPDAIQSKPTPVDGSTADPTPKKPAVKLLDDGDGTGQPAKKPTVKLLDDGDAPAPTKPKVKVLDE